MYKLSLWASRHVWPSRFIIIGSYLLLNIIGLAVGQMLFLMNIIIPPMLVYVIGFIFFTGVAIYPSKKNKSIYRNHYFFQKVIDLLLVTSTFFLIVFVGNNFSASPDAGYNKAYAASGLSIKPVKKPAFNILNPIKRFFLKNLNNTDTDRGIKKKLKHNLAEIRKHYKEATSGEKIVLIILSVIIAVLLLFLVASLSCSISCAGSDGLAILVALAGTGLIVFLLIKAIRSISHGPKPKRARQINPTL